MSTAIYVAVYRLSRDWHSGQNSRGYRALCLASRALKRKLQPDQEYVAWPGDPDWPDRNQKADKLVAAWESKARLRY